MRNKFREGKSSLEDMLVLVGILSVIFLFVVPEGSPGIFQEYQEYSDSRSGEQRQGGYAADNYKAVSLGRGNASVAYQPYEEYVTITNHGSAPVDITGWTLANGMDERTYDSGGNIIRYSREEAAIPQGTLYVTSGPTSMRNIVLEPGETAVITTGSVGVKSPYFISSFKENVCSGYLDSMPEYSFTPPISRNCPAPRTEPGLSSVSAECQNFVKRMPSCSVPEFNIVDRRGEPCTTCVNGERLTSACYAFVQSRFNYGSCVAYHSGDENFYGNTWRVFLGRSWEMWAEENETIKLYDRQGNLADSLSY